MGAWIEILYLLAERSGRSVAPLVGAWIEIGSFFFVCTYAVVSLLSWERGLKLKERIDADSPVEVAPLVGAWIEIYEMDASNNIHQSLLSWERGLKWLILLK